jgi:hypothetical protein
MAVGLLVWLCIITLRALNRRSAKLGAGGKPPWYSNKLLSRRWAIIVVLLCVVFLTGFALLAFRSNALSAAEVTERHKVIVGSVYFVIMLAGMAVDYMFGLQSPHYFRLWDFVHPYWISLFVFSAIYTQLPQGSITFAGALLSLENGYCWKKIKETIDAKHSGSDQAASPSQP